MNTPSIRMTAARYAVELAAFYGRPVVELTAHQIEAWATLRATKQGEKTMGIRAKMKCSAVEKYEGNQEIVKLQAVYGKEGTANAQWSKFTPNGNLSLTITNPEAIGHFTPGQEYFIDISPAPADG